MEWILLFAFAVIVSIGVKPVSAHISSSTNPTLVKINGSYPGQVLLTASAFFVVIVAAALLMDFVGEKPSLP